MGLIFEYKKIVYVEKISSIRLVNRSYIYISIPDKLILIPSPVSKRDLIYIDIDDNKYDYWIPFIDNNKLSLYPSVDFVGEFGNAHFYLIKNKVFFVE